MLGQATGAAKKRASRVAAAGRKKPSQITEQDMLLDLMGGDATTFPAVDTSASLNGTQASTNNADLLADILGGGGETVASPVSQNTSPLGVAATNGTGGGGGGMGSIMDLFDSQPASQLQQQPSSIPATSNNNNSDILGMTSSSQPPQQQQHTAYDKPPLLLTFAVQRTPQAVQVQARFRNSSPFETLGQVNLQAAVPKTQKLQLQAISSSELAPGGGEAGMGMRVVGVGGVSHSFAFHFLKSDVYPLKLLTWKRSKTC